MRLIDTDALIEALDSFILDEVTDVHGDTVREILERLTTIEERKTGEWEEREVSSDKVIDEWQSARCSVCGKYHTTPYMYFFDDFNFCPNCGARMER